MIMMVKCFNGGIYPFQAISLPPPLISNTPISNLFYLFLLGKTPPLVLVSVRVQAVSFFKIWVVV